MSWLLAGIVWIVYGALGVGGIQKIHEKYKGKYWTDRYKRDCGVAWIILGVAWVALYVVFRFAPVTLAWWYRALAGVVCSIPALVYAVLVDRKYKAMLRAEQDPVYGTDNRVIWRQNEAGGPDAGGKG